MSYYVIKDHVPYTVPGVISAILLTKKELRGPPIVKRYAPEKSKLYWLSINNQVVTHVIEYLDGPRTEKVVVTLEQYKFVMRAFEVLASKEPFPLVMNNFEYNGFFGRELPGHTEYTGRFVKWTGDPGIVLITCSDGKDRIVPTFAIDLPYFSLAAPQPTPGASNVVFGTPAKS